MISNTPLKYVKKITTLTLLIHSSLFTDLENNSTLYSIRGERDLWSYFIDIINIRMCLKSLVSLMYFLPPIVCFNIIETFCFSESSEYITVIYTVVISMHVWNGDTLDSPWHLFVCLYICPAVYTISEEKLKYIDSNSFHTWHYEESLLYRSLISYSRFPKMVFPEHKRTVCLIRFILGI